MPGNAEDSQAIDLTSEARFRVGAASIDPVSHEATFNGSTERLQPQNLKVLIALADKQGRVVTRDELIRRCWDGRVIGDDVINRAISTLRQFAERAGGFGIETVPRSGYRLVERPGSVRRRRLVIGAVAISCALAASAALVLIRPGTGQRAPATLAVALLPFESGTTDPTTRAIAFAAHDSVSHALSQSRYAVTEITPGARSGDQAANFVMSGHVSGTPDKLIATVRMEESSHHVIVYSKQFEVAREKAWSLPEQIGPQVAGSLGWTEPLLLVDRHYPYDPQALRELLAGSSFETTQRVAARAPDSAVAQLTLAFAAAFSLSDLPRGERAEAVASGRRAAGRAQALAPQFGGVYIPWCLLHSSVRMVGCEDRLRSAIRGDPDSPWLDFFLADRLKDVGRTQEALDLARSSLTRDQYVPAKIALTLRLLEATGQQDEAEKLYRQAQRWWPGNDDIFWRRFYGIFDRGDFHAMAQFQDEARRSNPAHYVPITDLVAAVRTMNVGAARTACPLTQADGPRRDLCMLAFARVGDVDDAFALVERQYPDRVGRSPADEERIWLDSPWVADTDFLMGTAGEPLRRDPRFLELARRLGLLAYWQTGRLPDFCRPPRSEPVCATFSSMRQKAAQR